MKKSRSHCGFNPQRDSDFDSYQPKVPQANTNVIDNIAYIKLQKLEELYRQQIINLMKEVSKYDIQNDRLRIKASHLYRVRKHIKGQNQQEDRKQLQNYLSKQKSERKFKIL